MKVSALTPHSDKAHAQNCVYFSNPYINLLVLPSATREWQPRLLKFLDLLQCIAAHLQSALAWFSGET